MSIKNSIIQTVLNYFGIDDREAEIIKDLVQEFNFEETEDEITITCEKGFKLTVNK